MLNEAEEGFSRISGRRSRWVRSQLRDRHAQFIFQDNLAKPAFSIFFQAFMEKIWVHLNELN